MTAPAFVHGRIADVSTVAAPCISIVIDGVVDAIVEVIERPSTP